MSVSPQKIAEEVKLYRESGHRSQSVRLLSVAKTQYPTETCLAKEEQKLAASANPSFPRCRWALAWMVDVLGLPLFFVLMAFVAYLLAPIIFIESW